MASQIKPDPEIPQLPSRGRQLVLRQTVRCRHYGPARHEKPGGRPAGLPEPDDEHALIFKIHRSFNVLSANSAQTKPAIQNRVMIFDSGQPSASK